MSGQVPPEIGKIGMLLPVDIWDNGSKGRPSSPAVPRLAMGAGGWDCSLLQVDLV